MIKSLKVSFLFGVISFFSVLFTGCEIIGDIFKAGIWVGVIIVVIIIAVIIFIMFLFKKKS